VTGIKVFHLATTLRGGAGIAARRTHEALLESGVESTLISLTANESLGKSISIHRRSTYVRFLSKFNTLVQSRLIQNSDRLVTPFSIESLDDSDLKQEDFDVLHIHSFYNLLSIKRISEIAKRFPSKKIFVTMHDQRFFTGGCHYSGECVNYSKDCASCPQVRQIGEKFVKSSLQESIKALSTVENLRLIAPSNWLMEKSKESSVASGLRTEVIGNPIPPCFFSVKSANSLQPKKIYFISANLNNSLKGIDVLIPALNYLKLDRPDLDFNVVFVGQGSVTGLDSRIDFKVTTASTDLEMAKLLKDADILVVPSLEDNLPSTMLEALASNCTVIGSRVGGITEVLHSAKMQTFKVGDFLDLTRCITNSLLEVKAVSNSFISEYSYENVAKKLVQAYSAD
jgi:glycosyltransferase involved in cell wall biosynthesis